MVEQPESAGTDRDRRVDRRRFVQTAGAAAGVAALGATFPAGPARAAAPPGASAFAPLPAPVRVLDTRAGEAGFARLDDRITVALAGHHGVPPTASAVVATVTGVNEGPPNWIAVFPSGGAIPTISNLNLIEPGIEANANLVTVKLGGDGAIDIASRLPCHVIVDLIGYYEPISGDVAAGRYVGLDVARRVLDTRPAAVGPDATTTVDLSSVIPADASAAVINVTATETSGPGYCTVYPYTLSARPASSSLNWSGADVTRAAAVIAQVADVDGRRRIKIDTARSAAKLIVDVTGYYTGPASASGSDGAFVPLDPVRILDTRRDGDLDPQTPAGVLWPQWTRAVALPGEAATRASSVLVNLTGANTRAPGYLTVWPARAPRPDTSNVNFSRPGAVAPNHAVTRVTQNSGLQVFTSHGSAIVVDLGGYFVGTPAAPRLAPEGNPPPPPIGVPWTLRIPGLGVAISVIDGDADAVTNAGMGWHWTGTGDVGEAANLAVFAHRSESGGAFRHLQYLSAGDEWYLDTTDGRRYVYVMERRDLTNAANANILAATRFVDAPACSLIACTVGYDSTKTNYPDRWAPTSKLYRIVVTGRLDRWFAR